MVSSAYELVPQAVAQLPVIMPIHVPVMPTFAQGLSAASGGHGHKLRANAS